jgi:hypothetical protein
MAFKIRDWDDLYTVLRIILIILAIILIIAGWRDFTNLIPNLLKKVGL